MPEDGANLLLLLPLPFSPRRNVRRSRWQQQQTIANLSRGITEVALEAATTTVTKSTTPTTSVTNAAAGNKSYVTLCWTNSLEVFTMQYTLYSQ